MGEIKLLGIQCKNELFEIYCSFVTLGDYLFDNVTHQEDGSIIIQEDDFGFQLIEADHDFGIQEFKNVFQENIHSKNNWDAVCGLEKNLLGNNILKNITIITYTRNMQWCTLFYERENGFSQPELASTSMITELLKLKGESSDLANKYYFGMRI